MPSFHVADRFCPRMKLSWKVVETIAIFKLDDITHLTTDFFQEGRLKLLWLPEKKLVKFRGNLGQTVKSWAKGKICKEF